jgi:hypothetical protein
LALAPLFLATTASPALAQTKPKEVLWSHAFDLGVRKYGEAEFSEKTQKFGTEVFKDNNNNFGVYVTQNGGMAIGLGFGNLNPPVPPKSPEWLTGLDLPCRKAGEKEFKKETKVHCMEVFLDASAKNWMYVTDKGYLAVTTATAAAAGGSKPPKWVHSVDLKVRKGGDKEFTNASTYGVEVYRDQNTGNLIFICETGSVAVVPETKKVSGEGKAPAWLHGLDVQCRKSNEPAFSKDTRKYGVEVFHDVTTGMLLFICETGHLAVAPAKEGLIAPTSKPSDPKLTHGLNVRCRKFGEKEFSTQTQAYGAELFRDENVGVLLCVNETGVISAVPTK